MTLEEIKYFTDQFSSLRNELKQDIRDLRKHIDATLGGHSERLDEHDDRLHAVENNHWRMTAIWGAIVFAAQIAINVAIELFKK